MGQWQTVLKLWIPGTPVPQGSKNAIPLGRRAGKRFVPICRPDGTPIVNVVDNNADKLGPWRAHITSLAIDAWAGREALDEDVCVHAEFVFPRLKGHFGTGRNEHVLKASAPFYKNTKPDKDKLERALFDGLTDAGVWTDDAKVVDGGSRKLYGTTPGVRLWVQTTKKETPSC